MEALTTRRIKSGEQFNHLFPKAQLNEITIKRNADLQDTILFIPKVVHQTQWQTKKIAALLKGKNVYDTCRNVWHFVYQHIAYHKDKDGFEQIRSPARAWHDRFQGVDCDCYSVFISTILCNLHIAHQFRITKYQQDFFQHIYPIVPHADGTYITIDCVVNQFNYEEPFTEKKDYNMNLQYLNGINDDDIFLQAFDNNSSTIMGMQDDNWLGDLGRKHHHHFSLKEAFKKGLHFVNRINPGATLLRNGVLASLKLNLFKVAQRLKWAYLTPEQAQQKGILPDKYEKLVQVKDKLEKIFYGAGGKPQNFRHAMLKGKGNKHRDVALFGLGDMDDVRLLDLTPSTPLVQLLGADLYHAENVEGLEDFEGIGALGEPVTATAAIASASGVMATIASILKSIGNIFHPNSTDAGAKDFDENEIAKPDDVNAEEADKATQDAVKLNSDNSDADNNDNSNTAIANNKADSSDDNSNQNQLRLTDNQSTAKQKNTPDPIPTFWEKNKVWIKPTASIAAGITLFAVGYWALKPKQQQQKPKTDSNTIAPNLSGISKRKKRKRNKSKSKKKAVALM